MSGWTQAWIGLRGIVAETLLEWSTRAIDPRDPAYTALLVTVTIYFKSRIALIDDERKQSQP